MPKTKKKQRQRAAPFTTRAAKTKQPDLPILRKLRSPNLEERKQACNAIAMIITEGDSTERAGDPKEAMKLLLEHNVIKGLMDRLVDKDFSVRVAATGALRNLAVEGGESVCDNIVQKDVLTPLLAVLQQSHILISSEQKSIEDLSTAILASAEGSALEAKHRDNSATFLELLQQSSGLLLSLCQESEKALETFGRSEVFGLVLNYLMPTKYPEALIVDLLRFLNVITDENSSCSEQLKANPTAVPTILQIQNNPEHSSCTRVTAASILFNIRDFQNPVRTLEVILPVLLITLQSVTLDQEVAGLVEDYNILKAGGTEEANDARRKSFEQKMSSCIRNVTACRVALEVLTNFCSAASYNVQDGDSLPAEVVSLVSKFKVSERVEKYVPISVPSLPPSPWFKRLAGKLDELQETALVCVGNMALFLADPVINTKSLWAKMCLMCTPECLHLGEVTTNMYALLRNSNDSISMSETEVKALFDLSRSFSNPTVQANCLGMLGLLAQLPRYQIILVEFTKLLQEHLQSTSVVIIAEALNAVFDVFGRDEEYFEVQFRASNFMATLQQCVPHMNKVAQLHKAGNDLDENLKERFDECYENLGRFLEYKQNKH